MGKFISFDKTEIHYFHDQKNSPLTIVFIHGVGGNWTVWKNEMRYFQRKGYSTLVLDLRGHGMSGAPEAFENYKLPFFTKDIYQLLNHKKINNFVLVGHSLGAAIAINYCMLYKKNYPSSVILVEGSSTYPFSHNHLLNLNPYITHLLRFISQHKLTKKEHLFHLHDVDLSLKGIREDLHLISHLIHLTPLRSIVKTLDNVEKYVFKNQKRIDETLRHLKVPTLLIAGEKDQTIPLKFTRKIKRLNKNAKMQIIKGGHHETIIERPTEVSQAIYRFIKEFL